LTDQIISFISPLIIGGIAGITVTGAIFPKVIATVSDKVDKANEEIGNKNKILQNNQEWKETSKNLENKFSTIKKTIDLSEYFVIVLFALALLGIIIPLYNAIFGEQTTIDSTIKILIGISYGAVLLALGIMLISYYTMLYMRNLSIPQIFSDFEILLKGREKLNRNS